jgi:hypothetical protein
MVTQYGTQCYTHLKCPHVYFCTAGDIPEELVPQIIDKAARRGKVGGADTTLVAAVVVKGCLGLSAFRVALGQCWAPLSVHAQHLPAIVGPGVIRASLYC